MYKFTQHLPRYVDYNIERFTMTISSLDELFSDEKIKYWSNKPNFAGWARSENCLMAMLDDNTKWYVVGRLEPENILDTLQEFDKIKIEKDKSKS